MIIKPEKRIIRELYNKGLLPTELFDLVVNGPTFYNRIPSVDDSIKIRTRKKILTIEYRNYQNFDWVFKHDSTCRDMIKRLRLSMRVNHKSGLSVLKIKFRHKVKYINTNVLVSDIIPEPFGEILTARAVSKYSSSLAVPGSQLRSVIFETLLNICNHEYREHGEVELEEFIKLYKDHISLEVGS